MFGLFKKANLGEMNLSANVDMGDVLAIYMNLLDTFWDIDKLRNIFGPQVDKLVEKYHNQIELGMKFSVMMPNIHSFITKGYVVWLNASSEELPDITTLEAGYNGPVLHIVVEEELLISIGLSTAGCKVQPFKTTIDNLATEIVATQLLFVPFKQFERKQDFIDTIFMLLEELKSYKRSLPNNLSERIKIWFSFFKDIDVGVPYVLPNNPVVDPKIHNCMYRKYAVDFNKAPGINFSLLSINGKHYSDFSSFFKAYLELQEKHRQEKLCSAFGVPFDEQSGVTQDSSQHDSTNNMNLF